ncbi:unnamed protein product [Absidia cylindrospora]
MALFALGRVSLMLTTRPCWRCRIQLFQVLEGDRIAPLVLEKIYTPDVVEVRDLDTIDRGAGGYGLTGH